MEFFALALVLVALIVSFKPIEVTIHHTYKQHIEPTTMISEEELKKNPQYRHDDAQSTLIHALNDAIHGIGGDDGRE